MSERHPVLLLGFRDQHDALAGRLLLLGFRPSRADTVDAAVQTVERNGNVRAALFPSQDLPEHFVDGGLERIRDAAGGLGIRFVAVGGRPGTPQRDALRAGGASFCLWEPFNDSELRFVVNGAVYDRTRGNVRGELRVPTRIMARVSTPSKLERPAFVYNLSTGGAFLETPRPVSGGTISVRIPLPDGDIAADARIVTTNVPGNLQKENLPMGMGVAFEGLGAEDLERLEKFVAERRDAYEI